MSEPVQERQAIRFGSYTLDVPAGELHKNGTKVRLPEQPFQILLLLLERSGEVVTREELRQRLWSSDTFVDFETGLNSAVKKLRDVLGDSAEKPRFVETIPRRGYRFIYPLNNGEAALAVPAAPRFRLRLAVAGTAGLLLLALVASIPSVRDRLLGRRVSGKSMRVAVLPLKNLSGDSEQEYFAAGMTEMLITELGRISSLQVTSHQSVLAYTQSSKPLPQIARELGVDAVVEGTVQRVGDRVRVTINFVQAQPENHLIAQSYDKDARDIFEVQEDVARAIAGAVRVNLPARATPSLPARQVSPEAMEAYLHGRYLLAKGREADRDQARVYFQQAIEMDPRFARPYAALAVMYAHGGAIRAGGTGEAHGLTRQWAEKALQLDDSLAEAHAALAWLSGSDWDFKTAEKEYKRAIELNPSEAVAHAWYAQFLGATKRYSESFAQAEIVLQLAPGSPSLVSHAVEPYLMGGRVDDAMAHFREVLELQPDYWAAHHFLGRGYYMKGMYPEAVAEGEAAVRFGGAVPNDLSFLASAYAKAGQREKALKILHDLENPPRGQRIGEPPIAAVYAVLGEKEKALALLENAYNAHRPGLIWVDDSPLFDSLRPDPRFQDILRRVGLPQDKLTAASASPLVGNKQ
jgi:TolB-like protein/DNA-binding winged helix-turn-helix (wHTH) protein/Flp pilus assembly protein TadD